MGKKVYLAIPYSHPERAVRLERFELANRKAAELINQGYIVFSPISMSHPMCEVADLPGDWAYWEKFDKAFLEFVDELYVVMADGWTESVGVNAEIEIMQGMGKPVRFLTCMEVSDAQSKSLMV